MTEKNSEDGWLIAAIWWLVIIGCFFGYCYFVADNEKREADKKGCVIVVVGCVIGIVVIYPFLPSVQRAWAEQRRQNKEEAHLKQVRRAEERRERESRERAVRDHQLQLANNQRAAQELDRQRKLEDINQLDEERRRLAVQEERERARRHLRVFYATNKEYLVSQVPEALMEAWFWSEMPDNLEPSQLWAICQKKIADLHPLVIRGKARLLRAKEIESEITACNSKIANLERSTELPEVKDDEIHGQLLKIKQLEFQKELVMTLGNGGDS